MSHLLPKYLHCTARSALSGPLMLVRGIRMKGRNRVFSINAEKEDDMLLKELEEKYELAKARLAKEEEAERSAKAAKAQRAAKRPKPPQPAAARPILSHNLTLWNELISKDDQLELGKHGIRSMDELRQAYEEAETDLNRPPYPPIERLRPRLRLAHHHYKTIPKKLAFRRPKAPGP